MGLTLGAALLLGLDGCGADQSGGLISDSQYTSTKLGVQEQTIRSSFGQPLSADSIPDVLPVPSGAECSYYEDDGTTIDGTTYRFCFKAGVLDLKDGYGPLFDSGQVRAASR
jgi:hypothetical protein